MDINFVRTKFPALEKDFIFMDNAGGSQVVKNVIDNIQDYLINNNVQLGASYEISAAAGEKLKLVTKQLANLINAENTEEVIVGPSTSMLLRILSICLSRQWQPGDEVIVTNSDHEANVSCWTDLKEKGIVIKIWKVNPQTLEFDLEDLQKLLSSKTKLLAMVHASNILGTINPISEIAKIIHDAGALICVDGVAYAPHRLIDVQAFGVDFYVFSTYKVYGPHSAILYGKLELLEKMDGINHYFIDEIPYKFQPGNFNFELTYGLLGLPQYLVELHDFHFSEAIDSADRTKFRKSFDLIADYEQSLSELLVDYLKTKENIQIIGKQKGNKSERVPTISFIHKNLKSAAIVEKIDPYRIGIRFGDFYAKKLVRDLGLVEKDGVVRVSLVHYNTHEEVEALIKAFEEVL
jgi:cysteine desulfurase family protein (TIGR01976 family)